MPSGSTPRVLLACSQCWQPVTECWQSPSTLTPSHTHHSAQLPPLQLLHCCNAAILCSYQTDSHTMVAGQAANNMLTMSLRLCGRQR
jgi:hypothetical protein